MKVEHQHWLAAAIDGEGCIIIRKRGSRFQAHLVIANNHLGFLRHAQELMGAGKIYHSNNNTYQVRVEQRDQVLRVLGDILPYLIVKKERAQEAIATMEAQQPYVVSRANGKYTSPDQPTAP